VVTTGVVSSTTPTARQRELEIAVASTLAEPGAARADGDAAGHDQIDASDLRGRNRHAERGRALDRRGLGKLSLEVSRIEAKEAALGAQARDGHQHGLALPQGRQAHRALGRVGIALDPSSGLPLRQLGQSPRGRLGAREVRDPVVER